MGFILVTAGHPAPGGGKWPSVVRTASDSCARTTCLSRSTGPSGELGPERVFHTGPDSAAAGLWLEEGIPQLCWIAESTPNGDMKRRFPINREPLKQASHPLPGRRA